MKAIFMSGNMSSIHSVYAQVRDRLESELTFLEPVSDLSTLESRKDELNEVDYIFSTWGMFSLTAEQIKTYFGKLKAVFYGAGSVQAFARPFIEAGIAVFSAWGANGVPVAEYTVAQIILANKGFFQRLHRPSAANWSNKRAVGYYTGNYRNKVGLIGCGMIGSMVAERLQQYQLEVLAFDPFMSEEKAEKLGVKRASLEEIFTECTVISNHLANNPQTVGMLNADLFDRMKQNTVFINTGRGAQVVEADLIAALEAEPNRTAVLDVTFPEPPVPESKFFTLNNVFLTPHIAGSLGDEVQRMGLYMYEEYKRLEAGVQTKWGVSLKMLETMA